jgi:NAD(P)H-quinone oxidoreductase subunit N
VQYLITLTQQEPKIKVVLEMGGDRYFRWEALENSLKAA